MTEKQSFKESLRNFPEVPGVYLMKDSEESVLYVGKAKNLRNRVRAYFTARGDERQQIEYLVAEVTSIDYIITDSEHHAFLLERDLIFKHKPRFNIKLKDDRSYLSIRLDERASWPRLELVRQRRRDGARYFGPYSFSYELRTLMRVIHRVVPLRSCSDQVFANRSRPCLEYQIKRCCGPCCLPVDQAYYRDLVSQAENILEGNTAPLVKALEQKMEQASEELRFEDAAELRDRLQILEKFQTGQRMVSHREEDRDVLGVYREGRAAVVSFLFVRTGRIADSKSFVIHEAHLTTRELVAEALLQFYVPGREIPPEILLPTQLQEDEYIHEHLLRIRGAALQIVSPQRGLKYRLLGLAELNARENFFGKLSSSARYAGIAEELQQTFQLQNAPRRIECVDISHLQGSDIFGAVICFFDGKPYRKGYRRYSLSELRNQDDFESIYQVIHRRLSEEQERGELPDLIVIDGGVGQLQAAVRARDELSVSVDIVSIAKERKDELRSSELRLRKKPERVFVPGRATSTTLERGSGISNLLARLRDEVHNYAIGAHRRARAKRMRESALDQVPGVGPKRKTKLLKAFGSVAALAKSTPETMVAETGVPYEVATRVSEHLNPIKKNNE